MFPRQEKYSAAVERPSSAAGDKLNGKMWAAHVRNQSGGYHGFIQQSSVRCSDTLDGVLSDAGKATR